MKKIITSNLGLCVGCNECVHNCPIETANINFQDESGNIKVKIDQTECITCGQCVHACKHKARLYTDELENYFVNGNNPTITWHEDFNIGNEKIDLQHRELFDLVNGFVNICIDGYDSEKLQENLTFLVNYALQHFHYEEALQIQCKYPDYQNHRQIHENFKQTVGGLVARFNKSGSSSELSKDVNNIIVGWLIDHILHEDKKLGEFMKNQS